MFHGLLLFQIADLERPNLCRFAPVLMQFSGDHMWKVKIWLSDRIVLLTTEAVGHFNGFNQ